jgi:hypothetical protein
MGLRHGFTLIDFFSAALAVYLIFAIFERSAVYRAAGETARWFSAAAFVFLVQYYFAWITWYQRPETLPTTAVLAASLWLLGTGPRRYSAWSIALTSASLILLAGVQGFIRPDAIFAFHLGIILVCFTRLGHDFPLPRAVQAMTSLLCVLIAGAVQFYLMHVVYPHAGYGSSPVFELWLNLVHWMRWTPFVLFMLPWVWLVTTLARIRSIAEAPGLAVMTGSAIYLVMWSVVGSIEEVRIFLPFAVALVPLTCGSATQVVLSSSDGRQAVAPMGD